jgi:hypothetical protein
MGTNERVVGVYEMLWNCAFCGTKALRGKTNRNCPSCGAPQDPARRYFPPPGQETAANTTYEGVDRLCPACKTPNGARANNCCQCGSPLDGAASVQRVVDTSAGALGAAALPVAAPRERRWGRWVVLGLLASALGFGAVAFFWKKPVGATIRSLTWSREIEIETLGPVRESAWCDSMPSDAFAVSRSRRQRGTTKIADGQDCSTRNVDRGDGTFERREVCTTRYREKAVYGDHCQYTVHRWRVSRTERAGGARSDPPRWPAVSLGRTGALLGSERTGRHRQQYLVTLVDTQGRHYQCDKPEGQWLQYIVGRSYAIDVRVITGGLDCGSLKP